MKLFKPILLVILTLALCEVQASVEGSDIRDFKLPPLTLSSINNFIQDYIRLCNKFKGRKYKKPLNRPEHGPLIFEEHRVVKENLISDLWNSFWGWAFNPSEDGWWKIFAMGASYFVIPFYGGYVRAQTYTEYMKDMSTYENADLTMDYLYMEGMDLSKMAFWEFFGLLKGGKILNTSGEIEAQYEEGDAV